MTKRQEYVLSLRPMCVSWYPMMALLTVTAQAESAPPVSTRVVGEGRLLVQVLVKVDGGVFNESNLRPDDPY